MSLARVWRGPWHPCWAATSRWRSGPTTAPRRSVGRVRDARHPARSCSLVSSTSRKYDSGLAKIRVLVRKSTNQQLAQATILERTRLPVVPLPRPVRRRGRPRYVGHRLPVRRPPVRSSRSRPLVITQLTKPTQRGSLRLRRKVGYETATLALRTWLNRDGMPVTGHDSSRPSQSTRGQASF